MAKVVVIGAGRMGAGIAHVALLAGDEVDLRDVSLEALEAGRDKIAQSLAKAYEKNPVPEGKPVTVLERLKIEVGLEQLSDVDLVIEAAPEQVELKQNIWRQVSREISSQAVLATNTSSISITELARSVDHPERFLGMHFFNPVPVSTLVEVITGEQTTAETIQSAQEFVQRIAKQSIVVRDSPGFASSRLGVMVGIEAIRMLEEGVASAEDIDQAMVLGYGFPVGPLKLTDIVGLDVRLEISSYLAEQLGDRFSPPKLLRDKVGRGELGRKSGRGFYDWK